MGKYIIVPNISYSLDNLGQLLGIDENILYGKAIIVRNASFASNNLGQVTFINEPVGPTGETEPVGPTGETEPVGPTGETGQTGPIEPDYSTQYFTIESLQDSNVITATKSGSQRSPIIYYSLDDGETWSNQTLSSGTITFGTINTGDKIIFKSNSATWASAWNGYNKFNGSKNFKVYGNVMSLLNGDNFINNSEFTAGSAFNLCGLFYETKTIIDASNLILPATTLCESSYNGMFRAAENLVYGPNLLPALDVPKDAYSSMFEACTKLAEGPEILATTVSGDSALKNMFCMRRSGDAAAAMTKSPILRITNPQDYGNVYQQLFRGNRNITEVTILAEGTGLSFDNWLANTPNSGVIKKLSATTLKSGYNGIPSGWTTEDYIEN
jgi:hypothetical protein